MTTATTTNTTTTAVAVSLASSEGYEEEYLDPRIQGELERLNTASEEINTLEKELDEARTKFRLTLSQSTQKLNNLLCQNRKSIERARSYYTALALAKKTQTETQYAAVQFRRSSSVYAAAKETLTLAEQRLKDEGIEFTEAWQEMLNHSTMKMMDAEKDKMKSELEHHRKSQIYLEQEQNVQALEKKRRRSIAKAKPYFDMKSDLEIQLQQQKQNVDDLLKGVAEAKKKYKGGMEQLEKISEEIHQRRYEQTLPVREPGVGCDSDDDFSEDINLEKHLNLDSYSETESTDGDSLFSFDSDSVNLSHQDLRSVQSIDSAICSPKSLTLSSRGRSPNGSGKEPSEHNKDMLTGIENNTTQDTTLTEQFKDNEAIS